MSVWRQIDLYGKCVLFIVGTSLRESIGFIAWNLILIVVIMEMVRNSFQTTQAYSKPDNIT